MKKIGNEQESAWLEYIIAAYASSASSMGVLVAEGTSALD